jgi:hypothetical protein
MLNTAVKTNGKKAEPARWFSIWICLALFLAAPACTAAAPLIHVEKPVHDFGEVKEGAVVEHAFEVANSGDQVLEIRGVKPS